MKQLYTIIFVFLTLFAKAESNSFLPPPTVDFTFNNNISCSGTNIQFNSTVTGDGPFDYLWNFGDATSSTAANPSHAFVSYGCGNATFNVTLTVTDTNGISVSQTHQVTVKQKPDIDFIDPNATGATNQFSNCLNASASNPQYSITVDNASISPCVTSYSINWGDFSPIQNNATFPASHLYTQLGAYTMTITGYGQNGCNSIKTYIVKNVSNPSGGINSPGSTQNLCIPTPNIQFAISSWATNSPGTTYAVDYGDGTAVLNLTQSTLNSSIYYNSTNPAASADYPVPHSYTTTSCPSNQFTVTLTVTNACGSTTGTVSNITTISMPVANFTASPTECITSNVLFTNISIPGYDVGCDTSTKYIWNFGDPSGINNIITIPFTTAIPNANHTFSTPGNYTVTLSTQNSCGTTTHTQQICIESAPVPQFTLNSNNGCTPSQVTTVNNTTVTNSCTPTTYQWNVTYAADNCGTSPAAAFYANGTTAASMNPIFNFTTPGNYTISLTASNSGCGSVTSAPQTVIVKKPPTASINAIPNFCGTATVTPSAIINGCAPTGESLSYSWSFPGGTPASANTAVPGSISYSTQGSHTISLTVTNSCGASAVATQTFAINASPTITNSVLSQTICSGTQTTPIALTATEPGTTYTWTATTTPGITGFTASGSTAIIPAQTISTTNITAGTVTYHITPSVGSCSGTAVDYIVTVNPAPAFTAQPVGSTVCVGGSPNTLTVSISNSTGTPLYQWYSNPVNNTTSGTIINGATNSTYTPSATTVGTLYYYCVITLSSGGCASLTSSATAVTITPAVIITTQPTPSQNACVGVTIASPLTVNFTGGTGAASYQWFINTINANTGGMMIPGATNLTYSPPVYTVPGTYYYYAVVSLGGNGCGAVNSAVAIVTVFPDPTIETQPLVTQTLCQGAIPTILSATASGGNGVFAYQWYSNSANNNTSGTVIASAIASTFTPPTINVGTTYYYCEVTQVTPGCRAVSNTAAVIVNAAPTFTAQPVSSTICSGGTPTLLSVAYTNGVGTPSYQWYSNPINSNVGGTIIPAATTATFNPPSGTVGTLYYYCIVTLPSSGGCSEITSNTAEVTITVGAVVSTQPLASQELCTGGVIAVPLTVNYTGGTGTPSYQWFSNTTNSNTGGTQVSGTNAASFTPPVFNTAGTYYYYVQISFSGNGCGAITSDVATIIVTPDPVVTTQPLVSQTVCQNAVPVNLTVTATGGVGMFAYQWYDSAGPIIGATNAIFTPPTTTVGTIGYYCVVSQPSGIGCEVTSATASVTVNLAPTFTSQPQSNTICLGATTPQLTIAYTNGAGTPQYQWFQNNTNDTTTGIAISGATTAAYDPPVNTVGTIFYYCVVTLPSGGCSAITSEVAEITVNQNPVIASEGTVICSGNAFSVTPISGGTNIIPAGTTYTWTTPIVNPAGAINGASAEISPQTSISQTLTNTTTGPAIVTYTVTPVSGICPGAVFTVTVTVNPSISPNVTATNSDCFGSDNASIQTNIVGGIPFPSGSPYLISWTGPNGFISTAPNIFNLEPGTYNLTVNDAGGCPFSQSYIITEPAEIIITTDLEKDITCFGNADGAIEITVSGGTGAYAYTWTKDTFPYSNAADLANLAPGTYSISVTDANNCGPAVVTFTITEPPLLTVTLLSQTNVLCFGDATGAISIAVTGGTPIEITPGIFDYTYAWTGPNGFIAAVKNLTAITSGVYNLTVTDNSGCTQNLLVTITSNPEIIIGVTTTPITCYGANNASISLALSGGIAPYVTTWSNLATGIFQDNLSAGDYVITVTDNIGCQKTITVNIPEAPVFMVTPVVNNISCFGANDGSINLNLVGGIPTVTLVWSDGSTAGTTRNNLPPGTYTATISDGTPCYITRTFTIVEPQPLILTANTTDALDCNDGNSGAINLIVAGGSAPFTYSWSNGSTTEDLTAIPAGNYQVTVTDFNGCVKIEEFVIVRQPPIVVGVNTATDFNCETHYVKQTFTAAVSGGIPPYVLEWSSGTVTGANGEIMETNTNGAVVLTATDSQGCSKSYTLMVDTPELGTVSFETASYSYTTYGLYSVADPIQFTGTVTGDYISIAWDFGDGTVSSEENPLHTYMNEGNYVVTETVTYPFGCVYVYTITLKVEKGYFLVVPNAFTPNKDGINETLRPVFKGLTSIRLEIYDTWGALIYAEEGATLKGWDGTLKGANAENGNYYCKVQAHTFYNQIVNENHPFILIK